MNALGKRQIVQFVSFKSHQCTRLNSGVNGIQRQQVRDATKAVQQIEAECPSFDGPDLVRQLTAFC